MNSGRNSNLQNNPYINKELPLFKTHYKLLTIDELKKKECEICEAIDHYQTKQIKKAKRVYRSRISNLERALRSVYNCINTKIARNGRPAYTPKYTKNPLLKKAQHVSKMSLSELTAEKNELKRQRKCTINLPSSQKLKVVSSVFEEQHNWKRYQSRTRQRLRKIDIEIKQRLANHDWIHSPLLANSTNIYESVNMAERIVRTQERDNLGRGELFSETLTNEIELNTVAALPKKLPLSRPSFVELDIDELKAAFSNEMERFSYLVTYKSNPRISYNDIRNSRQRCNRIQKALRQKARDEGVTLSPEYTVEIAYKTFIPNTSTAVLQSEKHALGARLKRMCNITKCERSIKDEKMITSIRNRLWYLEAELDNRAIANNERAKHPANLPSASGYGEESKRKRGLPKKINIETPKLKQVKPNSVVHSANLPSTSGAGMTYEVQDMEDDLTHNPLFSNGTNGANGTDVYDETQSCYSVATIRCEEHEEYSDIDTTICSDGAQHVPQFTNEDDLPQLILPEGFMDIYEEHEEYSDIDTTICNDDAQQVPQFTNEDDLPQLILPEGFMDIYEEHEEYLGQETERCESVEAEIMVHPQGGDDLGWGELYESNFILDESLFDNSIECGLIEELLADDDTNRPNTSQLNSDDGFSGNKLATSLSANAQHKEANSYSSRFGTSSNTFSR